MGLFRAAISALSMATTGRVIQRVDIPIIGGFCRLSLRLKQGYDEKGPYVVLAGLAAGNYQFYPMTAGEFVEFADAVQTIKERLLITNPR
jgi:hypothetical protein